MRILPTALPGVVVIEPVVHRDGRGFLIETFQADRYRKHGIEGPFVQDNQSRSGAATIRGLHLQHPHAQGKLVRVVEGAIFDVAVDVRRGSPTFGRWAGVTLSAENFRQCYIPPGFAHGFCVVGDYAQVIYKCTAVYDPASEIGIAWNDPSVHIDWPIRDPVVSARDRSNPILADVVDRLPEYSSFREGMNQDSAPEL
ncbi:MAG TPA: dTDP-4-dehydrorhamnose 3,5-epimerase [Vicinamibacterales bacterium]|nr:dTDP-4-dehydrorhamnose 3,5-epimerase [Vicinamibacterales bacterium]